MQIRETNFKVKCDVSGCKNMATYYIQNKGFLLDKNIYICESCIREIYEWYAKKVTPKSISNMLNKKGLVETEIKKVRRKKEKINER